MIYQVAFILQVERTCLVWITHGSKFCHLGTNQIHFWIVDVGYKRTNTMICVWCDGHALWWCGLQVVLFACGNKQGKPFGSITLGRTICLYMLFSYSFNILRGHQDYIGPCLKVGRHIHIGNGPLALCPKP